jgi:GDP-D-mannose dehydratase
VREIAERLMAMSDSALTLVVNSELFRTVDVPRLVGSPAKLNAATGWEPEIDLQTTMYDVLAEARTRAASSEATWT